MGKQQFNAKLVKGHREGSWTRIDMPFGVRRIWNQKGCVQVKGKIDDYRFDKAKLMLGNGEKYWLPINEKERIEIGKNVGDNVEVELERDAENVTYEVPSDFLSSLEKNIDSKTFFDSLTKSYQKWFILSIT